MITLPDYRAHFLSCFLFYRAFKKYVKFLDSMDPSIFFLISVFIATVKNWCTMPFLWIILSWYKPKRISIMNFKFAFNFVFELIWVFLPLLLSFTWIWKSLELLYFSDNTADLLPLSTVWSVNVFWQNIPFWNNYGIDKQLQHWSDVSRIEMPVRIPIITEIFVDKICTAFFICFTK